MCETLKRGMGALTAVLNKDFYSFMPEENVGDKEITIKKTIVRLRHPWKTTPIGNNDEPKNNPIEKN